jgi:hypothetical protein
MDSLLSTVKQGSQLFKESAEGTSTLASKAGLQKAPSTPQETAVIGGTPSQAKMAGTPAALQAGAQAKKPQLPTSLYLATQSRREQTKAPTAEEAAALDRASQLSQRLANLGSLGQRVPDLVTKGVQQAIDGVPTAPQIDTSAFPANLTPDQQTKLKQDIELVSAPTTPENKQAQMDALARVANQTGMKLESLQAPGAMDKFFKSAAASTAAAIDAATLNAINLGDLPNGAQALGYSNWAELATDLGIQVPEGKSADDVFAGMTVKELGEAVDTVKRTGYQTQQEWMSVLQDPTSSPQDRAVARSILRNMGATGVREAEASVAQLTEQVQAANRISLNLTGTPKSYSLDDLLNKDTLKAAVSILMNPQDPAYKSVSEANPALKNWVDANKEQLAGVIKDVGQDQKDLADLNAKNSQVLKLGGLSQTAIDKIGQHLYKDQWGKITGQEFNLTQAPLLANWSKLPASEQAVIGQALDAISDGGTDADFSAFLNTTRDNLVNLKLNTQEGLAQFKDFWAQNKLLRSIDISTNPDSALFDLTGYTPETAKVLSNEASALSSLGLAPGLSLPATVNEAFQRAGTAKSMDSVLKGSALPATLKDSYKSFNKTVDSLVNSTDIVVASLAKAVVSNNGPLDKKKLEEVASQVAGDKNSEANIAAVEDLERRTGQQFPTVKEAIVNNVTSGIFQAAGLPALNTLEGTVGNDAAKAGEYAARLRQVVQKVPAGAQATLNSLIEKFDSIVKKEQDRQAAEQTRQAEETQKRKDKELLERIATGSLTPVTGGPVTTGEVKAAVDKAVSTAKNVGGSVARSFKRL